jgi:hypothetical protein
LAVALGVAVGVDVGFGVPEAVLVGAAMGVAVAVGVDVAAAVSVAVAAGVGDAVAVGVGVAELGVSTGVEPPPPLHAARSDADVNAKIAASETRISTRKESHTKASGHNKSAVTPVALARCLVA